MLGLDRSRTLRLRDYGYRVRTRATELGLQGKE